ncbi:MAG: GNAT family N-acetyltransferase [Candidatus Promineifilaceae bacterium]
MKRPALRTRSHPTSWYILNPMTTLETARLGLRRLISLIDPANSASIAVAQKLGMTREGEVMLAGYTHPDFLFSLSGA